MKRKIAIALVGSALALGACQSTNGGTNNGAEGAKSANSTNLSTCGGDKFTHLVGKPITPISDLDMPGNSRYYGKDEATANDEPKRFNIVVSTENAAEAIDNPEAKIIRIFCG